MNRAPTAHPDGPDEPVKVIGGRTFTFGMLPPDKGFKVFMTLVRNFGAVFLSGKMEGLAASFFSKLNDEEIQWCMETLFSVTACREQTGGGRCTLTGTFSGGRLGEAFLVAVEAGKVNFANFLAVKDSLLLLANQMESQSSQSNPPTSTGTSGFPPG